MDDRVSLHKLFDGIKVTCARIFTEDVQRAPYHVVDAQAAETCPILHVGVTQLLMVNLRQRDILALVPQRVR